MRISARMSLFACFVFGLVCAGFAGKGLLALPEITDAAQRELVVGYTGFWCFLLGVAVVFGALSAWMARGGLGSE
jgi:hypothetical protein